MFDCNLRINLEPPKNTLFCSYRFYSLISHDAAKEFPEIIDHFKGLRIRPDYACPDEIAYMFDANGELTKVLIQY